MKVFKHTVSNLLWQTLETLMTFEALQSFRLVGGTCLSLLLGHRLSSDIDLFTDAEYGSIDFDSIDLDFYYAFLEFMTIEKNYSTNTIGKYIRNLKTIMYEAYERKLTDNDAFKSNKFIADSEEVDSIYLEYDVLDELFDLDLTNKPKLENARDLFLVYCFTGLRYEDATTLKYEQVQGDTISLRMHKTQDKVVVPFSHRITRFIRDKYKDITTNSLPRIISNAKLNLYIKEVCSLIPSLELEI